MVGVNPCARSKWRRARRVAPSSTPSDLTAYPSFASAIWAARTRGDPSSGLPRKRAPIWSGPSAPEPRSPLGADDRCCLSCAAGAIEDVVSGADAWVAWAMSPAGGAAAEAALYSEVGVGGAYGATGSTVPAGAAVLAEAGKGSCATEARTGDRMPPHLQQTRIGANSRDERGHAFADVNSPGRGQGNFHQQARRPAGCRPQQGCSVASAHEGFKQAWFPQQLIRKRPGDDLIPARPEWMELAKSRGTAYDPRNRP